MTHVYDQTKLNFCVISELVHESLPTALELNLTLKLYH